MASLYCQLKPMTIWYRHVMVSKTRGEWQMNHMAEGHETGKRPVAKHSRQRAKWARGIWRFKHVWVTAHESPKVVDYSPEDLVET